jgi:hypothetical protein
MKYTVEMASGGLVYIHIHTHTRTPNFMKISTGVRVILSLCLRNLRGCNVGITDGRDLWFTPLRWLHMAWCTFQVSWRLALTFKQYYAFASAIWVVVMLVLLMEGIYDELRWHDIHTKFHNDLVRHLSNIMVITSTIWEDVILVLLIERIYKARR